MKSIVVAAVSYYTANAAEVVGRTSSDNVLKSLPDKKDVIFSSEREQTVGFDFAEMSSLAGLKGQSDEIEGKILKLQIALAGRKNAKWKSFHKYEKRKYLNDAKAILKLLNQQDALEERRKQLAQQEDKTAFESSDVENNKRVSFNENENKTYDPEEPPECAICLRPIDAKDFVTTGCNHQFHYKCLKQSMKHGHRDCPLCRNRFDKSQFKKEYVGGTVKKCMKRNYDKTKPARMKVTGAFRSRPRLGRPSLRSIRRSNRGSSQTTDDVNDEDYQMWRMGMGRNFSPTEIEGFRNRRRSSVRETMFNLNDAGEDISDILGLHFDDIHTAGPQAPRGDAAGFDAGRSLALRRRLFPDSDDDTDEDLSRQTIGAGALDDISFVVGAGNLYNPDSEDAGFNARRSLTDFRVGAPPTGNRFLDADSDSDMGGSQLSVSALSDDSFHSARSSSSVAEDMSSSSSNVPDNNMSSGTAADFTNFRIRSDSDLARYIEENYRRSEDACPHEYSSSHRRSNALGNTASVVDALEVADVDDVIQQYRNDTVSPRTLGLGNSFGSFRRQRQSSPPSGIV